MSKKFETWKEFRKKLNITPEEEAEIQLEIDLIEAIIEARNKQKLSQEELSKKTGLKQPSIARIESGKISPTTNTLIKILYQMGYTLKVVPLNKIKTK